MADTGDSVFAACCGVAIVSTLESWCIIHAFGADIHCCGGPRGCCGSCCDASFNRDDFDERVKREQAQEGAKPEPINTQPAPSDDMSPVADSSSPVKEEA